MRRMLALTVVMGLLSGCAGGAGADQWPQRYHKNGVTLQQLNEDGGGCQTGGTTALFVLTILSFGLLTPALATGANRNVDEDKHAECMKTKGYTVTP